MDLKEKLIRKLKSPGFNDHKLTLTRRELIRLGLIAGGGALIPSFRLPQAFAETGNDVRVPFLVFDLAGGAAMPGNFLVGQKGGPEDLCENYRRHGWDPRASGSLNKTFGLPMSAKNSKILEGMLSGLPAEIGKDQNQKFFKMASFAHFSLDDTNTNRSSALTMVAKAGLRGSFVKAGLGMMASISGGNSDVYLKDSKFKPKSVRTPQDVLGLTLFNDDYAELEPGVRKQIFERLKEAAGNQAELRDAYESISELGVIEPKMDFRKNAEFSAIYNQNGSPIEASIVYNVLNGYTGPGVITIGGCDYHDGTGSTGDRIDASIGLSIGRAVAAAHLLKKPLMIQIITDGGLYAPGSNDYERRWLGDANQHSLSVLGFYHPEKAVQTRKLQVGHYTSGGQVEQATLIGASPEKMALGVLVNYLNLQGQLSQFEAVSGTRLQANEIDELLVFG